MAAIVLAVTFLLQLSVFSMLPGLNGPASLFLVLAIHLGILVGWPQGVAMGVVGGGMIDLWLGTGVSHLLCQGLTVAAVGWVSQQLASQHLAVVAVVSCMAAAVNQLLLAAVFQYWNYPEVAQHWLQTVPWLCLYAAMFSPLFYMLVTWLFSRRETSSYL